MWFLYCGIVFDHRIYIKPLTTHCVYIVYVFGYNFCNHKHVVLHEG
jgi:hypothetical protein